MRKPREDDLILYLKEVEKFPPLTDEEVKRLYQTWRKGDRKVRDKLIQSHLGLVVNIAKQYLHRGLSLFDLIEEGNLGLLQAVERFNPSKGSFSTYAIWWIKRAIQTALLTNVKTIQIPSHLIEIIARWKSASINLSQKFGRSPHLHEVLKELNLPPEALRSFKNALAKGLFHTKIISLDLIKEVSGSLPDETTEQVDEHFLESTEVERLHHLLDSISEREAYILKARYGLDKEDQPPQTLAQIARKLKLSRERVSQIEKNALKKLRNLLLKSKDEKNHPSNFHSQQSLSKHSGTADSQK